MKISKIQFSNVRGFKTLDIEPDSMKNILITGNNGNGKTTFLRALSLAFCDEMGAAGLLSELPGQFITYGEHEANISVELRNSKEQRLKIQTSIFDRFGTEQVRKKYSTWANGEWYETTEEELSQLDEIPHTNLFTVAYGTCLRILGKERYNHYYSADAMYSLFKIDTLLQEQELTIRRLIDQGEKAESRGQDKIVEQNIMRMIGRMLNEDDSDIVLQGNGIYFGANKEHPSELTTKGDGVRAVVTLVLDLMSWWYLHLLDQEQINDDNFYDTSQITGVVMVDEVALYLHPSWQRKIIGNFIEVFPNIQFIFTTHAPLCVSGATDYEEEVHFVRFSKDDDYSIADKYSLPRGASTDEILTSVAFGLKSTMSPELEIKMDALTAKMRNLQEGLSINDAADRISDIAPEIGLRSWHLMMQDDLKKSLESIVDRNVAEPANEDEEALLKKILSEQKPPLAEG